MQAPEFEDTQGEAVVSLRGRALGLQPRSPLDHKDSACALDAVQSLRLTAPTHDHISDFRAIVVEAA